MCFAYWGALPEGQKESVEEFTDTVSLVFCGCPFDRELLKNGTYSRREEPGRIISGNNRFLLKQLLPVILWRFQKIVRMKEAKKIGQHMGNRFSQRAAEGRYQAAVSWMPGCGFCEAASLRASDAAMCNPDYMMFKDLGVAFIRPTVVAQGYGYCDEGFVGDQTEEGKNAVIRKDENGFLYSDYLSIEPDRKRTE